FDVFNDADRVLIAAIDVAGLERQIVVVLGRIDGGRAGRAVVAEAPGAAETSWRDCRVWDSGGRAIAVLPSVRTLVQGAPEAVRVLDGAGEASEAARVWSGALRELSDIRMLRLMGLAPLVECASLRAAGSRVQGHLVIPENKREGPSERILFMLQAIAKQHG